MLLGCDNHWLMTDENRDLAKTPLVLILTTSHSYRSPAFVAAADRLGVDMMPVVDAPASMTGRTEQALYVDFQQQDQVVAAVRKLAQDRPVRAVLAVDDAGSLPAAAAAAALGLPHNNPQAALAARDKWVMRRTLAAGGMRGPACRRFTIGDDPAEVAAQVGYPCVVKPLRRSGSQGVIRADNPAELQSAIARLSRLLARLEMDTDSPAYLVEDYLPGREFALEGLLDEGQLHVLALFDKPDPLEGPFFEETIYVTPSRLDPAGQQTLADCAAQAAEILGLRHGPLHAEMRLNEAGAWILEVAGRSIGGLCSQTLRFGVDQSLEELILRQAVGLPLAGLQRESAARGVMMIPIPAGGLLRGVTGVAAAQQVPGIEEVTITARLHNQVTPLPEGDSYLGFIFARGDRPEKIEAALRTAHAHLEFEIEPVFSLQAQVG
jgi:biotin carboxylase